MEPKIPKDFNKALSENPLVKAVWRSLTPIARRDFILWIEAAKQKKTRKHRVKRACEMLTAGKRRPCCFAVVPMDLYKALGSSPSAKAKWKSLTPSAKRDFIGWINSAREPEVGRRRISKTCEMLIAGSQHP